MGGPMKTKVKLALTPQTTFGELVNQLIEADDTSARKDSLMKLVGLPAFDRYD